MRYATCSPRSSGERNAPEKKPLRRGHDQGGSMSASTTNTGELNWLLDDLATRVAAVRQAVILSTDGLAVGYSKGLSREDAEHLSAVAAGFQSLARGTGR